MELNYYAINRVLGGRMVAGNRPQFGRFGLGRAVGELVRSRPRQKSQAKVPPSQDPLLVKAFEDVRKGMAPERILWDADLASRFHRRARALGVHAPQVALNRKLITIRKSPAFYSRRGISLSPTEVIDPHPSIVPRYAHAVEFALVRLRQRYGASIDDILVDPDVAREYEDLVTQIAPDLSSPDMRLGALYIRKTHHVAKGELPLFEKLEPERMEHHLQHMGTLATISLVAIPSGVGLIQVTERDRPLYIARNENLRAVIEQFITGPTLRAMSNHFWKPQPANIAVRIFVGDSFMATSVQRWQLKLIQARSPVFNWPIPA